MNASVATLMLLSTCGALAESDKMNEAAGQLRDGFARVFGAAKEIVEQLGQESSQPDLRTPEEAGYLDSFYDLHEVVRKGASDIVQGEPRERKEALDRLKSAYNEWSLILSETLPPDSMTVKGLNVRENLLKLLEQSKKTANAEDMTDICASYLRTRADYNASIKARPLPGKDAEPKRYETRFTFRPLGNPLLIYTGNGTSTQGKFKVSLAIPTPLGGVVVWREPQQKTLKYLEIRYKQTRRFFRLDGHFEFLIEDEKMYAVSGKTEGEFLVLTVSSRSEEGDKPKAVVHADQTK